MINMLEGIWSDLTYAARSLAQARAFTLVCVVSLGIGMAPVIAVPYLARIPHMPPPGVNTEGLVEVFTTTNQSRQETNTWSYADFLDLRSADTGVELFGWATAPNEISLPDGAKFTTWPMYVSAGYFQTLGGTLARGPGFQGQTENGVILGYKLWQERLSSDPEIIGKTLQLDNLPYVILGIAPQHFEGHLGLQGRELFVPLERFPLLLKDSKARLDRSNEWLHIHGRLSQGVTVAQANAAVAGITSQLAKEYPATNALKAGAVLPYDPLGVLDRARFLVLQAIALTLTGIVLLVVCLNLSGMMQVRSAIRERELSIRQAIGASRFRLIRALLSEALLLASAGGTIASLVLFNAPSVVSRLSGLPIPVQLQDALRVDFPMVAICIGLCLLTTLAVGFLSAIRFSRPVILSSLKDDAGAGGFRVGRVHRFTAALQVGVAVPLLVIGGVSLDRVRSTATANLGFDANRLYAAPLQLDPGPEARAGDIEFQIRSLRDNLATATGIESATIADGLPLDFRGRPATVSLQADGNGDLMLARVQVTRVGDAYLKTMGIPLLSGRDFSSGDSAGAEKVTIISKPLAGRLFPNAGAEVIGKQLTFGAAAGDKSSDTLTIIGVSGDFPTSQMSTERTQLLLPLAQHNQRGASISTDESANRLPDLLLIARSVAGQQPERITASIEKVVRNLNPDFRSDQIITGASLRRNSMNDFLKQSAVAGAAGGVILVLSALGIYGVIGLIVATRTREIAVRVAMGASGLRVLRMILFDVVKLTAPGVAFGLLLAAAFMRLNGERMGIALSDMETLAYAAGAAMAILVAVVASLAPARRAASVSPMVALRSE